MNDESNKVSLPITVSEEKKDPQSIPSSFQINPEYFNRRLVRIKCKIDELIREHIQLQNQSVKNVVKQEFLDDEKRTSYQTVQTNHTSYGRTVETIGIDKIVGETKDKMQTIYVTFLIQEEKNEIHLLESVAVKDEYIVNTNTFELRSFLKDLRNQNKRLNRIIPQQVLFEMEKDKKQQFKKSQIVMKAEVNQQRYNEITLQINPDQKEELQSARKMIESEFQKRKIFHQSKRYYDDKLSRHETKCNLLSCQII